MFTEEIIDKVKLYYARKFTKDDYKNEVNQHNCDMLIKMIKNKIEQQKSNTIPTIKSRLAERFIMLRDVLTSEELEWADQKMKWDYEIFTEDELPGYVEITDEEWVTIRRREVIDDMLNNKFKTI